MNWYDVKRAVLQRMFALQGNEVLKDGGNASYLAGMPAAANEGLRILANVGRGIVRCVEVWNQPEENLLAGSRALHRAVGQMVYEARGARAGYFEVSGAVRVFVQVGAGQREELVCGGMAGGFAGGRNVLGFCREAKGATCCGTGRPEGTTGCDIGRSEGTTGCDTGCFEGAGYRSFLMDNPFGELVRLIFEGEQVYTLRNVALYGGLFANAEEVPPPGGERRIVLRRVAPDFMRLLPCEVLFEGERGVQEACFRLEGRDVLVIGSTLAGVYRVWYSAKPPEVGHSTDDEMEIPLDEGQAELLPLYMASQLYKDDDLAVATQYRNEFEAGLEKLVVSAAVPALSGYESGWL